MQGSLKIAYTEIHGSFGSIVNSIHRNARRIERQEYCDKVRTPDVHCAEGGLEIDVQPDAAHDRAGTGIANSGPTRSAFIMERLIDRSALLMR